LRNRLVHDVKNVSFSFKALTAEQTKPERKTFRESIGGIFESDKRKEGVAFVDQYISKPRFLIWVSTTIIVALAYSTLKKAEFAELRRSIEREYLQSLSDEQASVPIEDLKG
jgi:hypothetical protein